MKEDIKIALSVFGGIIFLIIFILSFVWGIEYYIFWMGGIMDKHYAQECERAIEYNLKLPYHCNTGSLVD